MLTQHRVAATCLKGKSARSILAGALGWWEASTYTSGAWVNGGTGGSALDFNLGAATAAPSFASGEFTFDGTDDYMYITDTAAIDLAASESLSMGLICNFVGALTTGERVMSKDNGAGVTYLIRASVADMRFNVNDGTSFTATIPIPASGSYKLIAGIRDCVTNFLTMYEGVTPGTPVALTSELAINNTNELRIGGTAANFTSMKVKAAFMFKRVLTVAELALIKNYYGA